jgi:hypothetical protein
MSERELVYYVFNDTVDMLDVDRLEEWRRLKDVVLRAVKRRLQYASILADQILDAVKRGVAVDENDFLVDDVLRKAYLLARLSYGYRSWDEARKDVEHVARYTATLIDKAYKLIDEVADEYEKKLVGKAKRM